MTNFNTRPRFQDRDIRQLSGDTITLSGNTNVVGNFRYVPGAVSGYVLTATDNDGTVGWLPSSGSTTGGTGNIYTIDGALTNSRVVDLADNGILFSGDGSNTSFSILTKNSDDEYGMTVSPNGGVILFYDNGLSYLSNHIEVSSSGVFVGSDFSGFTGIEYLNDYSNNYVNRSLVDKEYVDNQKPAYINYYDFTSGEITIIGSGLNWYKLESNTTQGFSRNGLVHTNNRVTYTGTSTDKIFKLEGIISVSASGSSEVHVAFFKGITGEPTLIPCSEQITTPIGGRVNVVPFQCLTNMVQNNYVEVWVKNVNGTNVRLSNLNVIVQEM
jgi:hypothetical protein